MSARDLSALSDDALNAEAARLMGIHFYRDGERVIECELLESGHKRPIATFRPTADLNHAAWFGAAFLAAHPDCHISTRIGAKGVDCAVYGANSYAVCMVYNLTSESRARTEAVCAAWAALEGERG